MAKYRLLKDHYLQFPGFATPRFCVKGSIIDYAGPPSLQMVPLDDEARAAKAATQNARLAKSGPTRSSGFSLWQNRLEREGATK
jgi:hypothetical protein